MRKNLALPDSWPPMDSARTDIQNHGDVRQAAHAMAKKDPIEVMACNEQQLKTCRIACAVHQDTNVAKAAKHAHTDLRTAPQTTDPYKKAMVIENDSSWADMYSEPAVTKPAGGAASPAV